MTTETQATDPARIAVPYGMALVPLQATFEMVSAFHEVTDDDQLAYGNAQSRWRAMLASAPVVAPLTLETAEEARADRAHAESYFRQAEKLLTANEQTLRAERDQLLEQLAAAQREVVELRAAIPAPEGTQRPESMRCAGCDLINGCPEYCRCKPAAPVVDRSRFEAYFAESRRSRGAGKRPTFEQFEDGTYKDDHTQRHWWTWQQARTALAAPAHQAAPAEIPDVDLCKLISSHEVYQYHPGALHEFSHAVIAEFCRVNGIPAPQTKEQP